MKPEKITSKKHPVDILKAICREWLPHLEIDEAAFEKVKHFMDNTDSRSVPTAVCHDHKEEYLTPLICTFAFKLNEFWCPYCGRTYGYLSPDPAEQSEELQRRHDLYEFASRKYLRAHAAIQGEAEIEIDGQRYTFEHLPMDIRKEYTDILELGWEPRHKAETLYDADYLQDFVQRRTGLESKDLQCPREKSSSTPCAARDGNTAVCEGTGGVKLCVGCEHSIVDLVHTEIKLWRERKKNETEEGS